MRKQHHHDDSKTIHNEYLNFNVKLLYQDFCALSVWSESYFCGLCVFFKCYVHSKSQAFLGPKEGNTKTKVKRKKNVLSNYFTMKTDLTLAIKTLCIFKPTKFTLILEIYFIPFPSTLWKKWITISHPVNKRRE